MVSPVTGPYSKINTTYATSSAGRVPVREKSSSGYRQRRPYNLPLAATLFDVRASGLKYPSRDILCDTGDVMSLVYDPRSQPALGIIEQCHNTAYSRFVNSLGENAGLALNYAQRKQGIDMIAKRAIQLKTAVIHLRKFEFSKAGNVLGISRRRLREANLRKEAKSFADNFLEIHFGWSPAVRDIGSVMHILTQGVPPVRARGSCRIKNKYVQLPSGYSYKTITRSLDCFQKLGADISVDNPNLWLANQMGLLNPLSVAWDAVPFSFVVDWFVNVNEVLSSFSDLWGLNIVNPYCTTFVRSSVNSIDDPGYGASYIQFINGEVTSFSRQTSLGGGPTLKVRRPWQLSVTRGTTAISLLIQKMR